MERRMNHQMVPFAAACVAMLATVLFGFMLIGAQPAQAATAQNVTLIGTHSKANASAAYAKTVKKYDITGDKKADTITIKTQRKNQGYLMYVKVYVNGKKAKTLSLNSSDIVAKVQYLRTSAKKPFLYISLTGVNCDGIYGVYGYKSGKLVKLVNKTSNIAQKYGTHMFIPSAKAKGKKVAVTFDSMTYTMGDANYIYYYTPRAGKLVRTSATATGLKNFNGTKTLKNQPLSLDTKIYANAGDSKAAFTAKEKSKVTILKLRTIDQRPWLYVKTASGKTGWIKGVHGAVWGHDNTGSFDTLFRNLHMAG